MSFKGTAKRTRTQLEQEIEAIGGHLNAYTSREQTVYYCKVTKKHIPLAMDVLSDILLNSTLEEANIERERGVILREMQEVDGMMEEAIFDRLHETAYRGTMMGKTILGSTENINSITRDQIVDYVSTHYVAPRMVIAGAGDISHDKLVSLSENFFGGVPSKGKRPIVMEPAQFTGSDIRVRMDSMPQAHVALGFPTAGWTDPDNFPLLVIQTMLGNWDSKTYGGKYSSSGMIADIAGGELAHSVSTFNTQYSDTGLFGIYAVADAYGQDLLMRAITRAMTSLAYNCDPLLLEEAKRRLKWTMLSLLDGSTTVCDEVGRQVLTYGRRMHPAETLARIDAVDENAVKNCATRYWYDRCHALAAIGPIHELPDYDMIRRKSYWLRY